MIVESESTNNRSSKSEKKEGTPPNDHKRSSSTNNRSSKSEKKEGTPPNDHKLSSPTNNRSSKSEKRKNPARGVLTEKQKEFFQYPQKDQNLDLPFVYFTENGTLAFSSRIFAELEAKLIGKAAKVVTVVGRTTSGKSTLLNFLLDPNVKIRPTIGMPRQLQPTTGDIHLYNSPLGKCDSVIFLDAEGEGGCRNLPPKNAVFLKQDIQSPAFEEFLEFRAKKVQYHFPRLGYLLSDIVVYVDVRSLCDRSYKETIISSAIMCSANQVTSMVLKPVLFIVCNKQVDDDIYQDFQESTNAFFEAHDSQRMLLQYYSDVVVITIPQSGSNLYNAMLDTTKKLIEHYLLNGRPKIMELIPYFSEKDWLKYTTAIVTLCNKEKPIIRVGLIRGQLAQLTKAEVQVIYRYFLNCLESLPYEEAIKTAFQLLACYFHQRLLIQFKSPTNSDIQFLYDLWNPIFKELVQCIERHAPCVARNPKSNKQCQDEHQAHRDKHRYTINTSWNVRVKLKKTPQLSNKIWNGDFKPGTKIDFEKLWEETAMVNNVNPIEEFKAFSFLKDKLNLVHRRINLCSTCLRMASCKLGCGHNYCHLCLHSLKAMQDYECVLCSTQQKEAYGYVQLYNTMWDDHQAIEYLLSTHKVFPHDKIPQKQHQPLKHSPYYYFIKIIKKGQPFYQVVAVTHKNFQVISSNKYQCSRVDLATAYIELLYTLLEPDKRNNILAFCLQTMGEVGLEIPKVQRTKTLSFAPVMNGNDWGPDIYNLFAKDPGPEFTANILKLLIGRVLPNELIFGQQIPVLPSINNLMQPVVLSHLYNRQMLGREDLQYIKPLQIINDPQPGIKSFEEAISILSLIPEFKSVDFDDCTKHCLEWIKCAQTSKNFNPHNLSIDEVKALILFTYDVQSIKLEANFYYQFNEILRLRNPQILEKCRGYLWYLQSGLKKIPNLEATVYRGVPSVEVFKEQYNVTRRIFWSGYSSATKSMDTAKSFANPKDKSMEPGTIMTISVVTGKSIKDYSFFPREEEILLSPNMSFIVSSELEKKEDAHYISLTQLDFDKKTFVY